MPRLTPYEKNDGVAVGVLNTFVEASEGDKRHIKASINHPMSFAVGEGQQHVGAGYSRRSLQCACAIGISDRRSWTCSASLTRNFLSRRIKGPKYFRSSCHLPRSWRP